MLNKVYQFRQCCSLGTITSPAGVGTAINEVNYFFKLGDLPQAAAFVAIFDQYRIDKVEVTWWPRANMNQSGAGVNGEMSTLITAIDCDNVAAVGSADALRQFGTCIETEGYLKQYRAIKPHIAVAAYQAAFTGFANVKAGWIDSGYANVQHYGLRSILNGTTNAGDVLFDLRAVYTVSFRNVN